MLKLFIPEYNDLTECAEVYASAYSVSPWYENYEIKDIENYLAGFLHSDTKRCFVVKKNEQVVGIALCLVIPGIGMPYLRIEDFCIRAEEQRCGIGSQFMELIIEEAKKMECDSVILGTQKDFPSHRFYLAKGFREIESVLLYREV